jgi:hypothetical protein
MKHLKPIIVLMRSKSVCALIILLCVSETLSAQNKARKLYQAPRLTPEIQHIQSQRKFFVPNKEQEIVLPTYVDNSKTKYFPPVIDQNGGSCAQASGIGYMFTYEMNRLLNRDASESDSNRFSYQFAWNMVNGGLDQGGFVDEGLFLAERYGIMTEQDYNTSGLYQFKWATGYDKYYRALHYKADDEVVVEDSIPLIKRYLYDTGEGRIPGGVLSFSTQSGNWIIDDNYNGPSATGYHSLLKKLATTGSHALTIAGYDDLVSYKDEQGATHLGAFIVVNSWGRYMHDNGRFYLPYDFFRDKSIPKSQLSDELVGVNVCTSIPKIVFKVRMKYTSRNDISFSIGGSSDVNATIPIQFYTSPIFSNQGGDYPMQGQWLDSEIEMALDFSDHIPSPNYIFNRYFLRITRSARGEKMGEGSVESISVIDYRTNKPIEYTYKGNMPQLLCPGNNEFTINTLPKYKVSASPYKWLSKDSTVNDQTLFIKTASGKEVQIRFSDYEKKANTVNIHYSK